MNNKRELGVIYVASGQRYVDEAAVSAKSLKKHMSDVPIHLHTDLPAAPEVFDAVSQITDCRYNCYDKVPPLLNSPFEKTVFLDTDTYIADSFYEFIDLLDRYDFLMCHTPVRDPNPIAGVPSCFTEFNTGMLAFRQNERSRKVLEQWLKLYEEMGHKADQPAFRKALWDSPEIRTYILPPEYNFRTIFPGFLGGGSRVKIIHGRHRNWPEIEQKLNSTLDPRVVILSPLERFGKGLIVVRKWSDLLKSFIKGILRK